MQIKDALKWNTRISAVYAIGMWTLICSFGYLKYTGKYDQAREQKVKEEVEPDESTVVYKTAHTKCTIVYKKDFVPYTTRIYNFLQPSGDEPPRMEGDAVRPGEADSSSGRV